MGVQKLTSPSGAESGPLASNNSVHPREIYNSLPLSSGGFRLFDMQQCEEKTESIVVDLFKTSISDNEGLHNALSYHWGDTTENHVIVVNGVKIPVTDNLYSALNEMRTQGNLHSLWVDSICIDQASVTKRKEQVQLMGQIYSQANMVKICFGEESENSNAAMGLVRECSGIKIREDVVNKIRADEAGVRALTQLLRRPIGIVCGFFMN